MNAKPQVGVVPGMLEKLDEMQGVQRAKISVKQRREVFFKQMNLFVLEGGPQRIELLHVPY